MHSLSSLSLSFFLSRARPILSCERRLALGQQQQLDQPLPDPIRWPIYLERARRRTGGGGSGWGDLSDDFGLAGLTGRRLEQARDSAVSSDAPESEADAEAG